MLFYWFGPTKKKNGKESKAKAKVMKFLGRRKFYKLRLQQYLELVNEIKKNWVCSSGRKNKIGAIFFM